MRVSYTTLALLGIVFITSAGLGCKSNTPPVNNAPIVEPPPISVTVTINTGGNIQNYTVLAPINSSVDAVMEQANVENNLQYSTKESSGLGKYVNAISGIVTDANAKKYWLYSINGVPSVAPVDNVVVQTGDTISWEYKNYN